MTFGSAITDETVTVTGCTGGSGSSSHGINQTGAFSTMGSILAINSITGGTGTGSNGFNSNANFASSGGGNITITASTPATGSSPSYGISLSSGTMSTTSSGTIQLLGSTTGVSSGNSNGVLIGGGQIEGGSGSISIGGQVSSNATGQSCGVLLSTTNYITGTGPIYISGTSLSSGNDSHGVSMISSCTTGTSETVTFGSSITDGTVTIVGCTGGSGSSSHGIDQEAAFSTMGSIVATNSITGGTGTGSCGFNSSANFASSGGGNITMTASTPATGSSPSHGIHLGAGVLSTTSTGTIQLLGSMTGANSGGSDGVNIDNGAISGGSGSISVGGQVSSSATGEGVGVYLENFSSSVITGSGEIYISGTSLSSGSGSYGVQWVSGWTTGTSGTVTFGSSITDGIVTIEGCTGGTGTNSHGIDASGNFSTSGDVFATNMIISGTGDGSDGFAMNADFASTGGDITITASSAAIGSSSAYGILIDGGTLSGSATGTNTIQLLGSVTGVNSGSSNGFYMSRGTISGGLGTISVGGAVSSNATGSSAGVLFGTTNPITSAGPINISGTSLSSRSGSYGVEWTFSWTTGTSGTVTFGASISDGTVTIEGCTGGTGSASHGLYLHSAFSTGGDVVATNMIVGGTGNKSCGVYLEEVSIASTGGDITITASTPATGSGESDGILLGGALSTMDPGTIQLIGTTTGASSGTSQGVATEGFGTVSAESGSISIGGSVSSSATGQGLGVNLGSPNSVQTSGPINISGTSLASGSNSCGVSSGDSWATTTSDLVTFGGTITDGTVTVTGCSGGSGSASHGITFTGSFTSDGDVLFEACQGGSGGGNGIDIENTFSTGGAITATDEISAGSGSGSFGFLSDSTIASTVSGDIDVDTSTISLGGDVSTTVGSISLTGDITLTAAVALSAEGSGGDVLVTGSVTGNETFSMTSALSTIEVTGDIDLSGSTGQAFMSTSYGTATFGGQINTSGTSDGANVSISSSNGSVVVYTINSSGTSGSGGNITLQPSVIMQTGSTGTIPIGFLEIRGTTLTTSGGVSGGAISLSGTGHDSFGSVATIFGSSSNNNSITFTGASFTMGSNEAMTVYGSVMIDVSGAAIVSDIIALDALTIDAASITLLSQPSISLLSYLGTFYNSPDAHLLAGTTPTFSVAVSPAGSRTGVSGAAKAQLIYAPDSLALNFDMTAPPPSVSTAASVYALAVANAQLNDLLPVVWSCWEWPFSPFYAINIGQNRFCQIPQTCRKSRSGSSCTKDTL